MIIFKKARSPKQTLNDLDSYLQSVGTEPIKLLARSVQSWGEISYDELADLIADGRLDDYLDWQGRYSALIAGTLAPLWSDAITAASRKATAGKVVLYDSNDYVRAWLETHGGELISMLSRESQKAVAMVILLGQSNRMASRDIAKQVRPLIGLNERQAAANLNYREKVYNKYREQGMGEIKARERADKAAIKYAGKQHRFRAETIVHTELAFAYNRGAHMGVSQGIADGLMGRCAMKWSTAGTNRVCSRCLALKDTIVGYTDESGVTIPPLHPRCRCAIIYDEVAAPRRVDNKPKVYRRFNDVEEANAYFGKTARDKAKPYGEWRKAIDKAEKAAVIKYTSDYYTNMNGWLRGFMSDSSFTPAEFSRLKKYIVDCETALEKSVLPDDILVHRQAGDAMLQLYKKAPNGVFFDEGFTSTTPVKGSFEGEIDIEINVPAGRGAGMWVDPISDNKGENEFLINRGTKFKVIEIDESGDRPLVKLEVIGREPREVKKMRSKENKSNARAGKFTWTPADVKVQDGNGNWINGNDFLLQIKGTN